MSVGESVVTLVSESVTRRTALFPVSATYKYTSPGETASAPIDIDSCADKPVPSCPPAPILSPPTMRVATPPPVTE